MEFEVDNHKLKVLFDFELDDKKYLAYINDEEQISASILIQEGDNARLEAITDDEEWDKVRKIIEEKLDNS